MFGLGPMELMVILVVPAIIFSVPVILLILIFKIYDRLKNIETILNKNKIS
jgi:hypothetical protein